MKPPALFLVSAFLATVAIAQGSPEDHAAHSSPGAHAAQAEANPATDMHRKMMDMQLLMDEIEKTSDPAKRKRLLEQHGKAMRAQLQSMQHMGEAMGKGTAMQGNMMECHEMMQSRMAMMTEMMDQMLRHQEAEHAPRK
jgi:hypothetical protein